jgi:outer membrane biosynthesis protein TonB
MVRFEINRQGQVSRYEIIKKAKSRYLNRSTNALFAGLHLPQPDASLFDKLPSTLTVPIKYSLN